MKLAVSNIAWQEHENEAVANIMQDFGIEGLEVAPTKVFSKPLSALDSDIKSYRSFWGKRGIKVVALQSLLFGRADLTIFGNKIKREETLDYLSRIILFGNKLGAKVLVFGSPTNRKVGNLLKGEIEDISLSFFYKLGLSALEHDMIFCIEPNPREYDCDYINTTEEAVQLVQKVNCRGFALNLDSGILALNDESLIESVKKCAEYIEHFHASEPYLKPLGQNDVNHNLISSLLRQHHYHNWVSLEMRPIPGENNARPLKKIFKLFKDVYSD